MSYPIPGLVAAMARSNTFHDRKQTRSDFNGDSKGRCKNPSRAMIVAVDVQ